MIVLTRGYMIRSTPYSYALLRKEKTKNKKTGEESEYLSTIGYFSTISEALKAVYRQEERDFVADNDVTLSEAIEALTRLSNQLLEEFRGTVIGDIL